MMLKVVVKIFLGGEGGRVKFSGDSLRRMIFFLSVISLEMRLVKLLTSFKGIQRLL